MRGGFGLRPAGQIDRPPRNLDLAGPRMLGELFHGLAIAVARGKILLRIRAGRILRSTGSTRFVRSKNAAQSSAPRSRRLVTQFPTDTWLTAWRWFSRCTTSATLIPRGQLTLEPLECCGRPRVAHHLQGPDYQRVGHVVQRRQRWHDRAVLGRTGT